MEFELDKEIDSLLRQTAKSDILFAKQNASAEHIDADEISIFAENALPEKAKPRVMKHLADCDRCRTILSNVIVLNAEAEDFAAVPLQATKAETVVQSGESTWFQKLFATKNLAFGMGALALIFAVGIGFIVVQNISQKSSGDLAQISNDESMSTANKMAESERTASAPSEEGMASNTDSTGIDLDSNDSKTDSTLADSTDSDAKLSSDKSEKGLGDNLLGRREVLKENKDAPINEEFRRNEPNRRRQDRDRNNDANDIASPSIAEMDDAAPKNDKLKDQENKPTSSNEISAGSSIAKPKAVPPPKKPGSTRSGTSKSKKVEERTAAQEDEKRSGKKASIKDKTFTRKNNVWTDSAYRGQRTTNVKRNTSQYRKLDAGLQSIGNQLSGTVVVVWKSTAYKIQ